LPGEFTQRAFEHGRIDLIQAEGLNDLINAQTEEQRALALHVTQVSKISSN
jgi:tRNA modification GTPase